MLMSLRAGARPVRMCRTAAHSATFQRSFASNGSAGTPPARRLPASVTRVFLPPLMVVVGGCAGGLNATRRLCTTGLLLANWRWGHRHHAVRGVLLAPRRASAAAAAVQPEFAVRRREYRRQVSQARKEFAELPHRLPHSRGHPPDPRVWRETRRRDSVPL